MGANKGKIPDVYFGSHLPALIRAMELTGGPVLEMGMGTNSSFFLHWACAKDRRPLVSYENIPEFFEFAKGFEGVAKSSNDFSFHKVYCIENWDEADIEKPWDVALIDHSPGIRRKEDIKRLANFAKYIVIHDTDSNRNHLYRYDEIWPLFKWKTGFTAYRPRTTVVSNFVDLKDF